MIQQCLLFLPFSVLFEYSHSIHLRDLASIQQSMCIRELFKVFILLLVVCTNLKWESSIFPNVKEDFDLKTWESLFQNCNDFMHKMQQPIRIGHLQKVDQRKFHLPKLFTYRFYKLLMLFWFVTFWFGISKHLNLHLSKKKLKFVLFSKKPKLDENKCLSKFLLMVVEFFLCQNVHNWTQFLEKFLRQL